MAIWAIKGFSVILSFFLKPIWHREKDAAFVTGAGAQDLSFCIGVTHSDINNVRQLLQAELFVNTLELYER